MGPGYGADVGALPRPSGERDGGRWRCAWKEASLVIFFGWSEDDCSLSWHVECRVTRPDGVAGVETHDGVAWQVQDGDNDAYEGYDLVDATFEGEESCAMSYDLRLYRP